MSAKRFLDMCEPILIQVAPELLRFQSICQSKLYKSSLLAIDDEANKLACKPLVKRMYPLVIASIRKSVSELKTRSEVSDLFDRFRNGSITLKELDESLELASRSYPEATLHNLVFDQCVESKIISDDFFNDVSLRKMPSEVLLSEFKADCGPRWNIQVARRHLCDRLKCALEETTPYSVFFRLFYRLI